MKVRYTLSADEIKEAVAELLMVRRGKELSWQDVEIEVYRDKDDRSGIETTKVTATATFDE